MAPSSDEARASEVRRKLPQGVRLPFRPANATRRLLPPPGPHISRVLYCSPKLEISCILG